MGNTQRTTQETPVAPELCSLCLSKHQRERQSECTCNHCLQSLCSDCMNDHINDLPQNVAQLSRQFHELEQLYEEKQNMVQQETTNSHEEIKQCFKTYSNDFFEAQQKIIIDVTNANRDAQSYLDQIYSEMQIINVDIENLAKETVYNPKRMEALLAQLNAVQQKLQIYQVTKNSKLKIEIPTYTLKFQCIAPSPTDTPELLELESTNLQSNIRQNKSSNKNKFHPYTKPSTNGRIKNTSSHNDET